MIHYFDIFNRNQVIMRVSWDTETNETFSEWKSKPHVKIPRILYPENITWKNVNIWLESRTVPRTRYGIEDILKKFGLKEYNAYAMCKKSHALSMTDFIWIRFEGEDISYDDIKVRQ